MSDENKKKKKAVSELTYWQKRFLKINLDVEKLNKEYEKEANKRYRELQKQIQKDIKYWIERYAFTDSITKEEAYELLTKKEQKTWSMTLDEFKRKALEGGYKDELDKEHFRSRISRLQQLENQLYLEFSEFADEEDKRLQEHLYDVFQETYLRNIYEFSDRGAVGIAFDKFSRNAVMLAISKPWLGSNFSKRIWGNMQKKLPDKLSDTLTKSFIGGWSTDRTVNEMMKDVKDIARSRMITLVQTESAHIAEMATQSAYQQTGVEKWEWLATLETHTCSECAYLDGKTFAIDDSTAPTVPKHPNCRCTSIPIVPGFKSKYRWQRDPITGKGSIGKNMSFNEWKKSLKNKS